MQPSDRAWLALAAGVVSWDAMCGEGQTLSEAADRWMMSQPWLVRVSVLLVAAHLVNALPDRLDPIHLMFGRRR